LEEGLLSTSPPLSPSPDEAFSRRGGGKEKRGFTPLKLPKRAGWEILWDRPRMIRGGLGGKRYLSE